MREIKFRAWNGGEWVYFNLKSLANLQFSKIAETLDLSKAEQFTGLKDKNGKEIFEGDIVICIHGTYEIVFTNGSFCLNNSKSPTIGFLESPIGNYSGENLKVIGNIYENPELLEGSK